MLPGRWNTLYSVAQGSGAPFSVNMPYHTIHSAYWSGPGCTHDCNDVLFKVTELAIQWLHARRPVPD